MAMIKCPNCGGDISDKAKTCIYCNYPLNIDPKTSCPECGNIIDSFTDVCTKCGYPLKAHTNETDVLKNTTKKKNTLAPKLLICITALCAIAGIGYAINIANSSKHDEDSKQVTVEYEDIIPKSTESKNNEDNIDEESSLSDEQEKLLDELTKDQELINYKVDYLDCIQTILEGAEIAENNCHQILCVWRNSIWEEHDDETDIYTFNGEYFYDFNKSLDNLFSDPAFDEAMNNLYDNKEEVIKAIKNLKKYPEGMQEAHELITELYDNYNQYMRLAINPDGSYNSYIDDVNNVSNSFFDTLDKIKIETDIFDFSEFE